MTTRPEIVVIIVALLTVIAVDGLSAAGTRMVLAQQAAIEPGGGDSPSERMRRRFPQPVRVGDLIGLRVLDDDNATIGRVRQVVRSPQGAILLIVSHGGWFGFGARLVAVPIEVLGIFGHQLASLDMAPEEYAATARQHGRTPPTP